MYEIPLWVVVVLTLFGSYGWQAMFSDFFDCLKKKNWKYPFAITVFYLVCYFVLYGVLKWITSLN